MIRKIILHVTAFLLLFISFFHPVMINAEDEDEEENTGLTLETGVIRDESSDYSSLTDFYKIEVFTPKFQKNVEKYTKELQGVHDHIEENIFINAYTEKDDVNVDETRLFAEIQVFQNVAKSDSKIVQGTVLYAVFVLLGMIVTFILVRYKYIVKGRR